MNRFILSVLFLFLILQGLPAQSLQFEATQIELGEVRNWGLQPAVFHFRNVSDKPVYILKTQTDSDIKIIYPNGYVQPGQRDSIVAYYVPRSRTAFRAGFEIYGSDSGRPYKLGISGNVVSLDECPPLSQGQSEPLRLVRVIEEGSGTPIPDVDVLLVRNHREKFQDETNRKGQYQRELKPGLYNVRIKHPGYHPYDGEFYLNRSTLMLTFELRPLQPVDLATTPAEVDTVIPLEIVPLPVPEIADTVDDRYLPLDTYKRNNIIFLVDVSSSMRSKDKLPLLKTSMKRLVQVLRSVDKVSLITYANEPSMLAQALPGSEKDTLNGMLDGLSAYGSTHGVKGMNKAYEIARTHFIEDANNLVIIATDGDFNGEEYSTAELLNLIRKQATEGISCSVVGFGSNTKLDFRMRQMALAGKGSYIHMTDSSQNVEELLVEEIKKRSRR